MLVASGNADMINKDMIGEIKRKTFVVEIEQDEYYSVTSECDEEEEKNKSIVQSQKKPVEDHDFHLKRFEKKMTKKIRNIDAQPTSVKFNSSSRSLAEMTLKQKTKPIPIPIP